MAKSFVYAMAAAVAAPQALKDLAAETPVNPAKLAPFINRVLDKIVAKAKELGMNAATYKLVASQDDMTVTVSDTANSPAFTTHVFTAEANESGETVWTIDDEAHDHFGVMADDDTVKSQSALIVAGMKNDANPVVAEIRMSDGKVRLFEVGHANDYVDYTPADYVAPDFTGQPNLAFEFWL